MTFEDLVPINADWHTLDLQRLNNNVELAQGIEWPNDSLVGWTYVYLVNGDVKYIGNTKSIRLSGRIRPELNQNIESLLTGPAPQQRKMGYTNIRISQQLQASFNDGLEVSIKAVGEIDYNAHFDVNENQLVVNDWAEFTFESNFLLQWSPSTIQGIHNQPNRDISIERALILRHINVDDCLPPWNLGLG